MSRKPTRFSRHYVLILRLTRKSGLNTVFVGVRVYAQDSLFTFNSEMVSPMSF